MHARFARLLLGALLCLGALPLLDAAPAAAVLPAPLPTTPSDGVSVTANPVFTWQTVPNATRYRIQIAKSVSFSPTEYDVTTFNYQATPPKDLPQTTLFWRVQAIDASSVAGDWSPIQSFTKVAPAGPQPLTPPDGATLVFPDQPPVLSWLGAAIADPSQIAPANPQQFEVEVDDDPLFTPPLAISASTPNNEYVVTKPQTPGQVWYWHVRSVSANGQRSQFSPTYTYTVTWPYKPTLLAPPDTLAPATESLTFSWTPVSGATQYQIQVSPDIDFSGTVPADKTAKSTKITLDPLQLPAGSYYWRVRGINSAGGLGPWSDVAVFTRTISVPAGTPNAAPTLLSPANTATDVVDQTFEWTPAFRSSAYQLQIATDANFSLDVQGCSTGHTRVTVYATSPGCDLSLKPGTKYWWRVRGVDEPLNLFTPYSDPFWFVYLGMPGSAGEPANTVTQLTPASGSSVPVPVLSWAPAPDIDNYRVTVVAPGGQQTTITTSSTSAVPQNLTTNTTYSWYVQYLDAKGNLTPVPAGPNPTVTKTAPTPGASPDPVTTGPESVLPMRMPVLRWTPVTQATQYTVQWAPEGSATFSTLGSSTVAAYAHATPVAAGNYQVRVQASTPSGPVVGTAIPVTVVPLASPTVIAPDMSCQPGCDPQYDMPTFEWTSVPGAGSYQVVIARDVQFTNVVGVTNVVRNRTKVTPVTSLYDGQAGQFYWYARPCAGVLCGATAASFANDPASPVGAFSKQSRGVVPLSPGVPDGSGLPIPEVADQITFDWQDFLETNLAATPPTTEEAREYQVQVSTLADFSSVYDQSPMLDETTYTASTKTYPEGPLYWRVRATDHSGNFLTFSPVWRLNKKSAPPVLLTPLAGANVAVLPSFTWEPQDFAAAYDIEVYKNPSQPLSPVNLAASGNTDSPAVTFNSTLPPGDYGWRVRRRDAGNLPGPWSAQTNLELRLFHIDAVTPTLLSPLDGSRVPAGVLLRWSAYPGAPQWKVEVSNTADFSVLLESQLTVMNAWAPTIKYPTDADYWWRVSTVNANGVTLATSLPWHFGRDVPGAPTAVVATAGDASANLTWTAPLDNGGSPISDYVITVSPGGAVVHAGASTAATVSGLTNGTTYTFTVAAVNGAGTGPASAASNAVTPGAAPSEPTGVTGVGGDGSVALSWTPPVDDGGSPITGYIITVSPDGTTVNVGNVTSTTVTGLTNGSAYTFTVAAVNAIGTGPDSAASDQVTPVGSATAPSAVIATAGDASAGLSWTPPVSNGGSPITGYRITVSPGGAMVNVGNVTSTTVTGLANGTPYTFTVAAVNGLGTGPDSAPSNTVTPRTVPGAPTGATASPGDASATLSWTAPVSNGGSPVTGYVITVSPGGTTVSVGNVTSTTVTGLTNGGTYTFTVAATNAAGTGSASAPSNAVTPRTVPGAPTGVIATGGNASAGLSWTPPASNGGSPVTGYVVTVNPGGATVNVGNVTTTTVGGLTNGVQYTFTVAATNAAGTGPASVSSNPVTPAATPGTPTAVSAAAGKQSATVSWLAPVGGATPTSYTVSATPGGATCTWTTGPLTCTVTGLSAGTSYTFTVTATGAGGSGPASAASNAVVPWDGSGFHAVTPFRILDSRPGPGAAGFAGPIGPGGSMDLAVGGVSGIPASASGVVMNVTVTGGTAASYLTVYPAGGAAPTTANLLFAPGQTVPNLVTVGLGAGGQVSFFNQLGSVHVIADVVGYYDDGTGPGDLFRPTTPARLLDSRSAGAAPWTGSPLGQNQTRDVAVRGAAGVPPTATAVVMNVTVTGGTAASYLQAYPSGAAQPVTANLLFAPGQTVPNLVTVGIGANGKVSLYNQLGSVHVIADVVGYFDPTAGGSRFHAINPSRLVDSRNVAGAPWTGAPLGQNQSRTLVVGGTPSIPAAATGLVSNVTVTGGSSASYLSVSPSPGPVPAPTANLTFAPSQTVPNAVAVGLGAGGGIDVFNQLGSVHVIIDAAGYYAAT